jgi:phosphatidylinositol glycan class T
VPASGIELTAWLERLEGENNEDERERWEAFTSAVSGLFCAGVVADGVKTSTSSPTWTVPFDGQGDERGSFPPFPGRDRRTDVLVSQSIACIA